MSTFFDRIRAPAVQRLLGVAILAALALFCIGAGLSAARWSGQARAMHEARETLRKDVAELARAKLASREKTLALQRERAKLDNRKSELTQRLEAAYARLAGDAPDIVAQREAFAAACEKLSPRERADCAELIAAIEDIHKEMQFAELLGEGQAALKRRDYDSAVAHYEEALKIAPGDPAALNFVAYAQFRAERLDAARAAIEASIRADPLNAYAWLNRVKIECRSGRRTRAERAFQDGRRATSGALEGLAEIDNELSTVCGTNYLDVQR